MWLWVNVKEGRGDGGRSSLPVLTPLHRVLLSFTARELLQRANDREVQTQQDQQGQQAAVVLNERPGRQAGCCAH